MCGIFGGHPSLLIHSPENALRHRGPDQSGKSILTDGQGRGFAFGMTRLSIVSRRPMNLPFSTDNASIVFNGEIYNWRDIRKQLEARGRTFSTETDIEVALLAYLEWGPACLDRFNGMFAIAIWKDGTLFLARDRLGKKPLFYMSKNREVAFASEMKCFRTIEFRSVDICEKLEFYFDHHTPFRYVKSLKPGEYLTWNSATDKVQKVRWWTFPRYEGSITDARVALREFLPLFEDACNIRQVADVPVTLFLSGGIDSSLIQAVLKLDKTFTVQFREFENTINEKTIVEDYAAKLGFQSEIVIPTREDFDDLFPSIARHIEHPVGSFSVFPLYCLSQAARKKGFAVALSGEGADELFNGYTRNEMLLAEAEKADVYFNTDYRFLAARYFGSEIERVSRMASRHGVGDVPDLRNLFRPLWNSQMPFHHNISKVEASIFLQPLLTMADRMSMAHGLEVRNPFIDHRIVKFSVKLAPNLRYQNGQGKYLLRRALEELLGPASHEITKRKEKHGLPAPVNQWMFNASDFDRRQWNQLLIGECLRQITIAGDAGRRHQN